MKEILIESDQNDDFAWGWLFMAYHHIFMCLAYSQKKGNFMGLCPFCSVSYKWYIINNFRSHDPKNKNSFLKSNHKLIDIQKHMGGFQALAPLKVASTITTIPTILSYSKWPTKKAFELNKKKERKRWKPVPTHTNLLT